MFALKRKYRVARLLCRQQSSGSKPRQERKPRSSESPSDSNNSLNVGSKPSNSSAAAGANSGWDDAPAPPASAPPTSKKPSTAGFLGGIATDAATASFSSKKPISKASVGENLARSSASAAARDPNAAWETTKTVGGAAASGASAAASSSDMPRINYRSARAGSGSIPLLSSFA